MPSVRRTNQSGDRSSRLAAIPPIQLITRSAIGAAMRLEPVATIRRACSARLRACRSIPRPGNRSPMRSARATQASAIFPGSRRGASLGIFTSSPGIDRQRVADTRGAPPPRSLSRLQPCRQQPASGAVSPGRARRRRAPRRAAGLFLGPKKRGHARRFQVGRRRGGGRPGRRGHLRRGRSHRDSRTKKQSDDEQALRGGLWVHRAFPAGMLPAGYPILARAWVRGRNPRNQSVSYQSVDGWSRGPAAIRTEPG
jgi:hypothetical protein